MRTLNDLHNEDPGEFQKHGHLVVEGYAEAIHWLSRFAAPLTEEQPALSGRGQRFDIPYVSRRCIASLSRTAVSYGVTPKCSDASRTSTGFMLEVTVGGHRSTVANALNRFSLAAADRQTPPRGRHLWIIRFLPPLRGNPYSRGGGAALAASLGASVNLANRGFYGHLYPAGVDAVCRPISWPLPCTTAAAASYSI